MAINLATRYPGRANPESVDYPAGSFKNRTTPDSRDGMILEQAWANDFLGARDAILSAAGLVADGNVETAQDSQVLQALNFLYKALASEAQAGILPIATTAEAQELTNDVKALTPKKLADAFGGGNQGLTDSGYQKIPGGLILQWGVVSVSRNVGVNSTAFTFPVSFPNGVLSMASTMMTAEPNRFQESIVASSQSGGIAYVNATHQSGLINVYFIAVGN